KYELKAVHHFDQLNLKCTNPKACMMYDAWPEGGLLPLAFHCYAMKVSCPSQSVHSSPGWPAMQGVLLIKQGDQSSCPNEQPRSAPTPRPA
ncbi:hypothetical protein THAOC_04991, partial [Thalassiosira oceanica]